MAILLGLILLCSGVYLWLIAPSPHRPDAGALVGWLYAHRGLHDGNRAVPENSLAAFERAVEAGYGIELDVQRTADNRLVVHHDAGTGRVCNIQAVIRDTPYAALPPLPDGTPIPLFSQVLAMVDGRVPLIVEIKPYGGPEACAAATLEALRAYAGPYCVESFHPLAVRYFRRRAPQVVRGQLAMGGRLDRRETTAVEHVALKYLLVNALGRPHFISYSSGADRNLSMWLMKRVFKPLLAAWTLRDQPALDQALKAYAMPIFELFTPNRQDS